MDGEDKSFPSVSFLSTSCLGAEYEKGASAGAPDPGFLAEATDKHPLALPPASSASCGKSLKQTLLFPFPNQMEIVILITLWWH